MITLECSIAYPKVRANSKQINRQTKVATARVPRISRLMALAIRMDQLIRDGVVTDQAELARLGRVTRARLTQIMNLIFLAPAIQEQILNLIPNAKKPITEKQIRKISIIANWEHQAEIWMSYHTEHQAEKDVCSR